MPSARGLLLVLALALPALAQQPTEAPPLAEDRAALLERYHQLPAAEQLRLRRLWEKELKGRPPEELAKLRRELKGKKPQQPQATIAPPTNTSERPPKPAPRPLTEAERVQRETLLRKLVEGLSPQERERLRTLAPEQRRAALKRLVEGHRRKVVDARLNMLPPDVLARLRVESEGLKPGERFKKVRDALEGHAREQLNAVRDDESLSTDERARRRDQILDRFVPDEQRRERMRKRIADEWQRRQREREKRERDTQRAREPRVPPGPGGPRRQNPNPPRKRVPGR